MTSKLTNADMRKGWPTTHRGDGRVEIVCPHGVGHPSKVLSRQPWEPWMGVHGCDGCCSAVGFAVAEIAHLSRRRAK